MEHLTVDDSPRLVHGYPRERVPQQRRGGLGHREHRHHVADVGVRRTRAPDAVRRIVERVVRALVEDDDPRTDRQYRVPGRVVLGYHQDVAGCQRAGEPVADGAVAVHHRRLARVDAEVRGAGAAEREHGRR